MADSVRDQVRVPGEEVDAVSDMPYTWRKLHDLASTTSSTLSGLQAQPRNTSLRKACQC